MRYLTASLKIVSLTFAGASVFTGIQVIVTPIRFSRSFGIPLSKSRPANPKTTSVDRDDAETQKTPATSYVSLMGVRQLATGILLLTFAYQGK